MLFWKENSMMETKTGFNYILSGAIQFPEDGIRRKLAGTIRHENRQVEKTENKE